MAVQFIGTGRLEAHQSAAYTGTAGTITNVVGTQTYKVRVLVTTDAYIKVGNSPTATTSDVYMPALSAEYFTCSPGQKVSAVMVTTGGTLHVTEIS